MTIIEIPKENFVAVSQYKNQPVFFFRYDASETENETVLCTEDTIVLSAVDYSNMVSALISVKYSLDAQLALLYNYQADAEKYASDMEEYQEWRTYCKESARTFFGIEDVA